MQLSDQLRPFLTGGWSLFLLSHSARVACFKSEENLMIIADNARNHVINTKTNVLAVVDIAPALLIGLHFDGELRLWCLQRGKSVLIGTNIATVVSSEGQRYVVAVSRSNKGILLDRKMLLALPIEEANTLTGCHGSLVLQVVQISPNLFATIAKSDCVVRIWSIDNGLCVNMLMTDRPCVEMHSGPLNCDRNWLIVRTEISLYMWRSITERGYDFVKQETASLCKDEMHYLFAQHIQGIRCDSDLRILLLDGASVSDVLQQGSTSPDVCILQQDSFAIICSADINHTCPSKILSCVDRWFASDTHVVVQVGKHIHLRDVRQWAQYKEWEHGVTMGSISTWCIDTHDPNVVFAACFDRIVLWDVVQGISWTIDTFAQFLEDTKYCFGVEFCIRWPDFLNSIDPSEGLSKLNRLVFSVQGGRHQVTTRMIKTRYLSTVRCVAVQDSSVHVIQHHAKEGSRAGIVYTPFDVSVVNDPAESQKGDDQESCSLPHQADAAVEAIPEQPEHADMDQSEPQVDSPTQQKQHVSAWFVFLLIAVVASFVVLQCFGSGWAYAFLSIAVIVFVLAQQLHR